MFAEWRRAESALRGRGVAASRHGSHIAPYGRERGASSADSRAGEVGKASIPSQLKIMPHRSETERQEASFSFESSEAAIPAWHHRVAKLDVW